MSHHSTPESLRTADYFLFNFQISHIVIFRLERDMGVTYFLLTLFLSTALYLLFKAKPPPPFSPSDTALVWRRLEKKSHICLQGLSPLSNTVTQSKTSPLSYSLCPGAVPCRTKKKRKEKKERNNPVAAFQISSTLSTVLDLSCSYLPVQ